jgi:hypothetical protein
MKHVTFDTCFGEDVDAYSILRSLLASNKEFLHIDIEDNNIRTGGGTEISDYLATNPRLEELHLADNRLDDNDAILIARALQRNTNLRRLNLDQNDVTDIGRETLRNAVFDSTSLNTVADSNHSCYIAGIGLDYINANEDYTVNRDLKLYNLLSVRNRTGINVHHLDSEFTDDSLKLVPKVLERVHIYSEDSSTDNAHPLSIVYELLRSWKMPILYENNGVAH